MKCSLEDWVGGNAARLGLSAGMSNKNDVKIHELFGEACIFLQWWNLAG